MTPAPGRLPDSIRPPGRHAALVGCTASGKSALALAVALRDPVWELVTVDSMQVYRGMDIGTAKPTVRERALVPHHLLDVADPWDDYDLATYQTAVVDALDAIEARGKRALLVGGTALYLRAVVDGLRLPGQYPGVRAELETEPDTGALHERLARLDPVAARRMEPTNRRRIVRALEVTVGSGVPFSSFGPGLESHPQTPFTLVGLRRSRTEIDDRIGQRYEQQMADGFLDEVDRLLTLPRPLSRTASQALGYRELIDHRRGLASLGEALDLALRRTRRFARRQERWFRRDPRIVWIDADGDTGSMAEQVRGALGATAE